MDIIRIISIALSSLAIVFGLSVFLRNRKSRLHVSFFVLSASIAVWIVANTFGGRISNLELSRVLVYLDFSFGLLVSVFFVGFASRLRRHRLNHKFLLSFVLVALVHVFIVLFPELTVEVSILEGELLITEGPFFYPVYAASLVGVMSLGVWTLFSGETTVQGGGEVYSDAKIGLRNSTAAAVALTVPSVFSGFLVSSDLYIQLLQQVANMGVTVFLVGMGSVVVRHRLFDVRRATFRAVIDLFFATGVLVFVSMAGLLILEGLFGARLDGGHFLAATGVIVAASLSAKGVNALIGKTLKHTLFRDAYNTQELIDKLSKIAVSEYDVDALAAESMGLLSGAIKPATGKFFLLDEHGDYYSDYKLDRSPRLGTLKAIEVLKGLNEQVFLVDDYEANIDENQAHSTRQGVYQYLKDHDVAMAVKLSTKDEIVGYILFGPKLSGNIYSNQDVQLVGIAANELSISIQNARRFNEIKEFNETLKLEVERATGELRASNEKLQALDQAKDEFITMASHQLRTPLTSVKGYVSMVLEGDTGKITPRQHEMLTAAFTSSQRMVYLIADLLNVSRLQTGKFVVDPSVIYLPDIISSEITQLKETAKAKNLKIEYKKPKEFPRVYLDETKTRQVLMNFIDNAIYYTPQGGTITIELNADSRKIEYKVTDDGIGVPKDEQKNLFTKFYRAQNARKARPDGTGLGLFMAKKVVIDQGGAIIFTSKEGHGSTFGFTFPLTRVRPPKE